MEASRDAVGFSLVEGLPLFERARRGSTPDVARTAVVLAAVAWVPLFVAAVVEGLARGWPGSFELDIGVHARALIALPVAIWAERPIGRRLEHAIRYLSEAKLIHDGNRAAAREAIRRAERLRELPWLNAGLALVAVALSGVNIARGAGGPPTWIFPGDGEISAAGSLYLLISAPLFRFVALRWLWRLAVWTRLLWGLARAPLHLEPAHPDGLGALSVVTSAHTSFGWITFALGTSLAGNLCTEKILFARHVTDYSSEVITFAFLTPALFLAPLLVFAWPLERARRRAHAGYASSSTDFAYRYDRAWIDPATRKPLPLGTEETSAHADLVTSFASVEGSRWLPFKRADYLSLFVPSAVPMVLFYLQELSIIDLLHRLKDTVG